MIRIRQVAPLLHIINFNNLCFRVENETTLISVKKNRVDLSSISEVRSYITEWPHFFGPPCICFAFVSVTFFNTLMLMRDSSVRRALSLGLKGLRFKSRQGQLSPSSILVDKISSTMRGGNKMVLHGSRISQRDELLYTVATGLAQYKPFTFTVMVV